MTDSSGAIGDPQWLRKRMEEDGYLYFERLVDLDQVHATKGDIVRILREHHIVEAAGPEADGDALWSGGPQPTEAEYMEVYDRIVRLESFQALARSPELVAVIEAICDEQVQVWEQQLVRLVYPDPEVAAAQGVGAHQDGDPKLGYRATRFYTGWISPMRIDESVGGLAVVPGSHRMGVLQSAGTVASSAARRSGAYGLDAGALEWVTVDYEPGSTVIFACLTAHRGLPNRSDRIRLSCDFRYQPASETASWLAHTLGPDVRRTAQQIDETVSRRALYVTTGATPEVVGQGRQRMLEERSTTLERAQELVREIGAGAVEGV